MTDKLSLLESVLGRSIPAHSSNVSFHCPFCNHPKPKLNVSLDSGAWGCWVCGQEENSKSKGRSVSILFHRLHADRSKILVARELWKESKVSIKKEQNQSISLPKEYRPLWIDDGSFFHDKAYKYAKSRGLTHNDLIKHRIGYCVNGRFADRIVLPSYDSSGTLNYYAGRSYLQNPVIKFLCPQDLDKDIITYEDQINWLEPIILVESQLDAITIRRNAIPLNGKSIRSRLKQKIIESRVPKVILCFDGDAVLSLMQQARYFIQNGIPVYKVTLPIDSDANSLGYDKIWKLIDSAEEITENESFAHRINTLLGQ